MTQFSQPIEPLFSSLGGDRDLCEIVELFVEEMPNRIATLLKHSQAADWEALRCTAHQLKGAAGSYGFDPISPCAGRVEQAIRDGQPEASIRSAVEELVEMCRRARAGTP